MWDGRDTDLRLRNVSLDYRKGGYKGKDSLLLECTAHLGGYLRHLDHKEQFLIFVFLKYIYTDIAQPCKS